MVRNHGCEFKPCLQVPVQLVMTAVLHALLRLTRRAVETTRPAIPGFDYDSSGSSRKRGPPEPHKSVAFTRRFPDLGAEVPMGTAKSIGSQAKWHSGSGRIFWVGTHGNVYVHNQSPISESQYGLFSQDPPPPYLATRLFFGVSALLPVRSSVHRFFGQEPLSGVSLIRHLGSGEIGSSRYWFTPTPMPVC